jgi:hypothetical protein
MAPKETEQSAQLPHQVVGTAAAFRLMPDDAPKKGYDTGKWRGITMYKCAACAYSSSQKSEIEAHVQSRHPLRGTVNVVEPPPNLAKGGVIRAITDGEGNVTGYEEVKPDASK